MSGYGYTTAAVELRKWTRVRPGLKELRSQEQLGHLDPKVGPAVQVEGPRDPRSG